MQCNMQIRRARFALRSQGGIVNVRQSTICTSFRDYHSESHLNKKQKNGFCATKQFGRNNSNHLILGEYNLQGIQQMYYHDSTVPLSSADGDDSNDVYGGQQHWDGTGVDEMYRERYKTALQDAGVGIGKSEDGDTSVGAVENAVDVDAAEGEWGAAFETIQHAEEKPNTGSLDMAGNGAQGGDEFGDMAGLDEFDDVTLGHIVAPDEAFWQRLEKRGIMKNKTRERMYKVLRDKLNLSIGTIIYIHCTRNPNQGDPAFEWNSKAASNVRRETKILDSSSFLVETTIDAWMSYGFSRGLLQLVVRKVPQILFYGKGGVHSLINRYWETGFDAEQVKEASKLSPIILATNPMLYIQQLHTLGFRESAIQNFLHNSGVRTTLKSARNGATNSRFGENRAVMFSISPKRWHFMMFMWKEVLPEGTPFGQLVDIAEGAMIPGKRIFPLHEHYRTQKAKALIIAESRFGVKSITKTPQLFQVSLHQILIPRLTFTYQWSSGTAEFKNKYETCSLGTFLAGDDSHFCRTFRIPPHMYFTHKQRKFIRYRHRKALQDAGVTDKLLLDAAFAGIDPETAQPYIDKAAMKIAGGNKEGYIKYGTSAALERNKIYRSPLWTTGSSEHATGTNAALLTGDVVSTVEGEVQSPPTEIVSETEWELGERPENWVIAMNRRKKLARMKIPSGRHDRPRILKRKKGSIKVNHLPSEADYSGR